MKRTSVVIIITTVNISAQLWIIFVSMMKSTSVVITITTVNISAQPVDYLCFYDEECSYLDNNSYCQQVGLLICEI
jgi:hypothetical protein